MKAWLARRRLTSGLRMLGHRPKWSRGHLGTYAWCQDCAFAWGGHAVSPGQAAATLRNSDVCRGRP